jgi:hypothetical protein
MSNIGEEQFTYDSFKQAYDADPALQELVKQFNQNGVSLKTRKESENGVKSGSKDQLKKLATQTATKGLKDRY